MNRLLITGGHDPYENLAIEEALFFRADAHMTLYLWQNADTVVIGRNQCAWRECDVTAIEKDGVSLARRTTGGGAVFHDLGNLNFTFTADREHYDVKRQLSVIIKAVGALGIKAEFTGRNDIVTETGAKFSGNAFRYTGDLALHHGTILISADMARLGRYLIPHAEKLASKGVKSVRSRVVNLCEIVPDVTVEAVSRELQSAFYEEYGIYRDMDMAELPSTDIETVRARLASWDWRMGASPSFDAEFTHRFSWGMLELLISAKEGRIQKADVFSDALDPGFAGLLSSALQGVRYCGTDMAQAALTVPHEYSADAAKWLGSAV